MKMVGRGKCRRRRSSQPCPPAERATTATLGQDLAPRRSPKVEPFVTFEIYIHVPFALRRCGYCDFNTYTAVDYGRGRVTRQLREHGYPRNGDCPRLADKRTVSTSRRW